MPFAYKVLAWITTTIGSLTTIIFHSFSFQGSYLDASRIHADAVFLLGLAM